MNICKIRKMNKSRVLRKVRKNPKPKCRGSNFYWIKKLLTKKEKNSRKSLIKLIKKNLNKWF